MFGPVLNCEEGLPDGGSKLWSGVGFIDLVLRGNVFATCSNNRDTAGVTYEEDDGVGDTPCKDACEIGVWCLFHDALKLLA